MSFSKEEALAAFKKADKDGNGKLTAKELKQLVAALGPPADEKDLNAAVKMVMSMADKDGDRTINYNELVELMCNEPDEKQVARGMFKMFDTDGNGKLSVKELIEMDKDITGGKEDSRGAKILLTMADKDGDGMVSFKEYCSLMGLD